MKRQNMLTPYVLYLQVWRIYSQQIVYIIFVTCVQLLRKASSSCGDPKSASGLAEWGGVSVFKKQDQRGVLQLHGDNTAQPPWEDLCQDTYRTVLLVKPWIQKENIVVYVRVLECWTSALSCWGYFRMRGSLLNQSTCVLWEYSMGGASGVWGV